MKALLHLIYSVRSSRWSRLIQICCLLCCSCQHNGFCQSIPVVQVCLVTLIWLHMLHQGFEAVSCSGMPHASCSPRLISVSFELPSTLSGTKEVL